MTNDTASILERVRKLLAKGNDEAATENEREIFLAAAHKLLAKHQLDMEDVPKAQREAEDPRGRYDTDGWGMPWCLQVRNAVAKLFDCKYLVGGKINATRRRHIWIGRASNTTTAALMSDWIVKSLLKEGTRLYGHNLAPQTRAFGTGAGMRLHNRVAAMKQQTRNELSAERGLAVRDMTQVELNENDAWIAANLRVSKAKEGKAFKGDTDAFFAGSAFADNINLSTQLANRAGTLQIK